MCIGIVFLTLIIFLKNRHKTTLYFQRVVLFLYRSYSTDSKKNGVPPRSGYTVNVPSPQSWKECRHRLSSRRFRTFSSKPYDWYRSSPRSSSIRSMVMPMVVMDFISHTPLKSFWSQPVVRKHWNLSPFFIWYCFTDIKNPLFPRGIEFTLLTWYMPPP